MKHMRINIIPQISKKSTELGHTVTGREISAGSGVHVATISAYKRGQVHRRIDLGTINSLAAYFGCDPLDLFSVEAE